MDSSEFRLGTRDGLALYGRGWPASGPERGVVGLVHGYSEHMGRYQGLASFLAGRGFHVLGFDQRGHGRSPGRRGAIPSYGRLLDDIDELLKEARARHPALPLFLYGHSMGGGEVLNFALSRRPAVTAVVAASPWLELAVQPPAWQLRMAATLNLIAPWVLVDRRTQDAGKLTHTADIARAYERDPLVHHDMTARLFYGCHRSGQWCLRNANRLSVPLLLTHGTADGVTSCLASQRFHQQAGPLCTYREWDGLFHELHNEASRAEEILSFIAGWMEARTEAPEANGTA